MTDYRFLNDKYELFQGYKLFLNGLDDRSRKAVDSAFFWHGRFTHHCVLSLSKSPRILSQWRAYASDGTGIALGFSEAMLKFSSIELKPCHYESHEDYAATLNEKHKVLVDKISTAREFNIAENDFADWVRENGNLICPLIEDLIALKNPAFAEEQEVRAIRSVKLGEASVRVSGSLLVPYVETKFVPSHSDEKPSTTVVAPEIWLGPKCNPLNRDAIYAMSIGFPQVEKYDCGYV
ncbi:MULTISPECIES: DUF2971 domain-containing protein [Cupriavidus]